MAFINFKPTDFFNSLLYTGNGGGTQAQTGLGFQPDITWIKCRSGAESHVIGNSVRGGNKYVYTNANTLEGSLTTYLKSFDADGFTVGSGGFVGSNNATYVGWNWKCGTTSGVSGGSITPLGYSFNATSKVSVVAYTGNGTSGATVPHGLGVKPAAMWVKNLTGSVNSWAVYHQALTANSYQELDVTNSKATNAGRWNNTEPTTSLFSLGDSATTNGSGNIYIAYIFGEVKGFSKFTEYVGTGDANGPYIHCGFQPAWTMIKEHSGGGNNGWVMHDNKRPLDAQGFYNVNQNFLQANDTGMESDNSNLAVDFLSNGIKIRNSAGDINQDGNLKCVYAFAEFPMVGSNKTAGVAR